MEIFAFILHPINYNDIVKKLSWARFLPPSLVLNLLKKRKAFVSSYIKGIKSDYNGEEIEGFFIACPLTSEQMVTLPLPYVYEKIIEAGKLAESQGASIVGLGAFTSVVGDGGITIKENLKIAVTTGNSYTVASAIEGTFEALKLMEVDSKDAELAIVGATGSIGKAAAYLMAPRFKSTVLIGRNEEKLNEISRSLMEEGLSVESTSSISKGIKRADAIVAVSSAVHQVIEPEMLKPGAVVCDVARPRDVSTRVSRDREDVLVIEGGVIKVPGTPSFNYNFGFPPGLAYACMSETMILTLERKYNTFSLGKELDISKVVEISELAKKHGFKLAGFRSFERVLKPEEIERIKLKALHSGR